MAYTHLAAFLLLLAAQPPAGDAAQQVRVRRLQDALLAPCCYSESVSRHQSDVARKMRLEIADWVAQGRTDRQILDTYKQLYGPRVLIEPEGAQRWWVYTVPIVVGALGLVLTGVLLRKWRTQAGPGPAGDLNSEADQE
jgi:cytochrome c-type biogenesis protein CcmH/NrfF